MTATMAEVYDSGSKSAPSSRKTTPIMQRLKKVSDTLAADSRFHHNYLHQGSKETLRSQALPAPATGDITPYRSKANRDMPRLKALGLVSSISHEMNQGKSLLEVLNLKSLESEPAQVEDSIRVTHSIPGNPRMESGIHSTVSGTEAAKCVIHSLVPAAGVRRRNPEVLRHPQAEMCEEETTRASQPDAITLSTHVEREGTRRSMQSNGVKDYQQNDDAYGEVRVRESELHVGYMKGRNGVTLAADIVTKNSEHVQNQPGLLLQRHGNLVRGEGLREWKGEYVREEGVHELELHGKVGGNGGSTERSSPARGLGLGLDLGRKLVAARPSSAPRRMQDSTAAALVERRLAGGENILNDGKELNAMGTYKSRGVQGVKEDCERFRLQMRMLKEKADGSRIREVEVEGLADKLQKSLVVDELDHVQLTGGRPRQTTRFSKKPDSLDRYSSSPEGSPYRDDVDTKVDNNVRRGYGDTEAGSSLARSARGRSRRSPARRSSFGKRGSEQLKDAHQEFEARRIIPALTACIPSYSSNTTSSTTSGSSSSLSSLPLSHYIQKLKHLTPDPRFPPTPSRVNGFSNPGHTPHRHQDLTSHSNTLNYTHYNHDSPSAPDPKLSPDSVDLTTRSKSRVDDSARDLPGSDDSPNATAILLPITTSSNHPPTRSNNRSVIAACQTVTKQPLTHATPCLRVESEQRIGGLLRGCAMVASHPEQGDEAINGTTSKQTSKFLAAADFTSQGPKSRISETGHVEAYEEKVANIQRLVGELKGSVEGFKIRIEVESESWRGRMESLEKELETLKDETDEELVEAKRSIRNEVKIKLGELIADAEKIKKDETEQVSLLVDDKIERRLNEKEMGMAEMKSEIRLLWAEVEALSKGREEAQGHVDHLTQVAQMAKENASREQDFLKSENGFLRKQLQSLKKEDTQVKAGTEDYKAETEDLRKTLEMVKDEGTDMKLEIQGLRNVEKLFKEEIEDLRKLMEKMQDDTEEMERERGTAQMEGVRERVLIMERVESLSQLYLGGLEEVRTDVYNVKFSCRDRVDKIESQWSEFKRHQEHSPERERGPLLVPRQMLLDELENVRTEMAEIVEVERALLRETLERESGSIRRQVMDVCANNKGEMMSMLKVEVQKRLQTARDKVLLMTDALKREMDGLKVELGEAREGTEDLARAVAMVEREKVVAASAAAEATMSAAKAGDILTEMLGSFSTEMSNARRKSLQLQENLALERDMAGEAAAEARRLSQELAKEKEYAIVAVSEVREKNQELQVYLERESSKIMHAVAVVHKEKDTASQAASDATSAALKAGEVLAEVLGSFNTEMAKARRMSMQLQEGLEREREGLEREREVAIQHSQEAQDRFSEELELAIAGWKRAMNAEVAKAKEVTEGLAEEKRRASFTLEQASLQVSLVSTNLNATHQVQSDMDSYISKTEDALNSLSQTVKQLQESRDHSHEEKKRRVVVKQQELEQREKDWKSELNQLNQVVRILEKRLKDAAAAQSDVGKRIKYMEGMQLDLVQSFEEVRSSTGDLEKTAAIWLPKYEAAARIVNELSSRVERMDEKFQGICCDEDLTQQIDRVAESKVQGLREMLAGDSLKDMGSELKNLYERVENGDRSHCQAISMLENRVCTLESTVLSAHDGRMSLKLEYVEKCNTETGTNGSAQSVGSLSQSIQALQRRMEMMAAERNDQLVAGSNSVTDARLVGLESRIEHVASATFTNLRLLDNKVEHVTVGVQSALEGAAMAESKCGALGAELVKVFRMLTSCRQNNSPVRLKSNPNSPPNSGRRRNYSPVPDSDRRINSQSLSPTSRASANLPSPTRINGHIQSPMITTGPGQISPQRVTQTTNKRGMRGQGRDADFPKGTQASSEIRKVAMRQERERGDGGFALASEEGGSPQKERWNYLRSPRETEKEKIVRECRLHGQALSVIGERKQGGESNLDGRLTIEKRQEGSAKNCQRTNIRLEAGRIHVNVSHRSAVVNQSEKRRDLIAVQS